MKPLNFLTSCMATKMIFVSLKTSQILLHLMHHILNMRITIPMPPISRYHVHKVFRVRILMTSDNLDTASKKINPNFLLNYFNMTHHTPHIKNIYFLTLRHGVTNRGHRKNTHAHTHSSQMHCFHL